MSMHWEPSSFPLFHSIPMINIQNLPIQMCLEGLQIIGMGWTMHRWRASEESLHLGKFILQYCGEQRGEGPQSFYSLIAGPRSHLDIVRQVRKRLVTWAIWWDIGVKWASFLGGGVQQTNMANQNFLIGPTLCRLQNELSTPNHNFACQIPTLFLWWLGFYLQHLYSWGAPFHFDGEKCT